MIRAAILFYILVFFGNAYAFPEEFSLLKRAQDSIEKKEYDQCLNILGLFEKNTEFPYEYIHFYRGLALAGKNDTQRACAEFLLAAQYSVIAELCYREMYYCHKNAGNLSQAIAILIDKINDTGFLADEAEMFKSHSRRGILYKKILNRRADSKIIEEYLKIYKPDGFSGFKAAARMYYNAGNYAEALKLYERANQLAPNWERKEDILLYAGRSAYNAKKYSDAEKYFNILKRSMNPEYQAEAYNYLYAVFLRLKNKKQAAKYQEIILKSNPVIKSVAEIHFSRGMALLKGKDYDKACSIFKNIAEHCTVNSMKADAIFWAGYCAENSGDYFQAKKLYDRIQKSFSKYQILEAAQVRNIVTHMKLDDTKTSDLILDSVLKDPAGAVGKFYLKECSGNDPDPFSAAGKKFYVPELNFSRDINSRHYQLAIKFGTAGLKDIASLEIKAFVKRQSSADSKYLAAFVLNWLEGYNSSVYYAESISKSGNADYQQVGFLGYPVVYYSIISKYAEKYNVDPFLILAVMREESRYRSNAISRSGACGLMQIMPSTGKWIAKLLKENYSRDLLYDPEYNIKFGAWYLSYLGKEFDHLKGTARVVSVLASYNGGIGNVKNWTKEYNEKNPVLFSELLKYSETRYYVKKVLRSYQRYHEIYQ